MAREQIQFELDPEVDIIFDEGQGNSFLALRRIAWGGSDNFRLDMRKWFTNRSGEETLGKGISFMTEEGPGNLINGLLSLGYGETSEVMDSIKDRGDFIRALQHINIEKENELSKIGMTFSSHGKIQKEETNDTFFDPKELFDD